jgi:spore coat polysaccharide biosynthesis protein SpsF (cytidylyltransferase family)
VGVVVQARTGSERLPGKVLEPIAGQPMLRLVLRRVMRARTVDKVVLATTTRPGDDGLVPIAASLGLPTWRGSEEDVLRRYLDAATAHQLDVVVRVTADCPLIDPTVVDLVVSHFLAQPVQPDYASNTWPRSVPTGLDAEVFTLAALRRADTAAKAGREREHVTLHFKEHPEIYRLSPVTVTTRGLGERWTVDEAADLEFVRAVYRSFPGRDDVAWGEVLALVEGRPDLAAINANVSQRAP